MAINSLLKIGLSEILLKQQVTTSTTVTHKNSEKKGHIFICYLNKQLKSK